MHLLTVAVQFALDSLDLFLFLFGLHNTYYLRFLGYFSIFSELLKQLLGVT